MERLIRRNKQGHWWLKGLRWEDTYIGNVVSENTNQKIYGALCKLKDYEATGLSPEEVERLSTWDGSQAVKATKKLQEEQRKHSWIPVADQLPKEPPEGLTDLDDLPEYIVTIAGAKEPTTLQYMGAGEWYWDGVFYGTSVVAWMHMPAVYKED